MDIAQLTAIEEIKQLKARYFRLMDTKRWEELLEVFSKDAVLGAPEDEIHQEGRQNIVDFLRRRNGPSRSVHHGCMPEIEIVDEVTARGIWAMFDHVERPEGDRGRWIQQGYGHYLEEYTKADGQWRIRHLRLIRLKVSHTHE
jgi:hypothetical protein